MKRGYKRPLPRNQRLEEILHGLPKPPARSAVRDLDDWRNATMSSWDEALPETELDFLHLPMRDSDDA